jgi:hypothetical protein
MTSPHASRIAYALVVVASSLTVAACQNPAGPAPGPEVACERIHPGGRVGPSMRCYYNNFPDLRRPLAPAAQ